MDEQYAERHEKFVSNLHGTTFWEVQLVTSIGPLSILLRNLAIPWLFPMKNFSSGSSFDKMYAWRKFLTKKTCTFYETSNKPVIIMFQMQTFIRLHNYSRSYVTSVDAII